KMSSLWMVLAALRWPFVATVAIMGINYNMTAISPIEDPERVLSAVIANVIPTGLKGVIVAVLLGSAMGSYNAVTNGAAAYYVQDIFRPFIKPTANQRELVFQGRLASVVIVLLGAMFARISQYGSVTELWGWVNMSLGAGVLAPLLVRWVWWRLNGYGFCAGIAGGTLAAIIQGIWFPLMSEWCMFLVVTLVSCIAMFIVTPLTKQTDTFVLVEFFQKCQPWGLWSFVYPLVGKELEHHTQSEMKRDLVSGNFAWIGQIAFYLGILTLAIPGESWYDVYLSFSVATVCAAGLLIVWYRHLQDKDGKDRAREEERDMERQLGVSPRGSLKRLDGDGAGEGESDSEGQGQGERASLLGAETRSSLY
ncbi:sodium/solute symporter, partial [Kipferlia bialata]